MDITGTLARNDGREETGIEECGVSSVTRYRWLVGCETSQQSEKAKKKKKGCG
jgi:hypothetical protein